MRLLIQRVKEAQVTVEGKVCGSIQKGLLLFLGIRSEDQSTSTDWLAKKVVNLRIFSDEAEKMNRSILEIQGDILVVSQFTLYGNCMSGRRPDFVQAASPEKALLLYEKFLLELEAELKKPPQAGIFGASMEVSLVNDGPVTFLLEKD